MTKSNKQKDLKDALETTIADTLDEIDKVLASKAEQDKKAISRAVEALEKSLDKGSTKPALTAGAFKAKYGRRRFTSSTAGKAVILNDIYRRYQLMNPLVVMKSEDKETGTHVTRLKRPQVLYGNMDEITSKITLETVDAFEGYQTILNWTGHTTTNMVILSNSLKYNLMYLYDTAANIMAAEELRHVLKKTGGLDNDHIYIWLRKLTIDEYTEQGDYHHGIEQLRNNIESNLRRIQAYNTYIKLIADIIEIPEFVTAYKVDMENAESIIDSVNRVLASLQDTIANYLAEEPEDQYKGQYAHIGHYSPEYMESSMDIFRPIEVKPPEVEEELLQRAVNDIKQIIAAPRIKPNMNPCFEYFAIALYSEKVSNE